MTAGVLSGSGSVVVVVVLAVEGGGGGFSIVDAGAPSTGWAGRVSGWAGSASAAFTAWGSPPLPPQAHTSSINAGRSTAAVCLVGFIWSHLSIGSRVTRAGLVVHLCLLVLRHRRPLVGWFRLV